ncbi:MULTISPECIES: hypothetical protein [unclassified Thioalkalivibrio]|uniref:hypothetical protein n=1 Tax=unclassified Thioalkalivibrio TaxID=2621013 RepID=UPI00036136D4|nr:MULTISPECIES: hypothetical protein [unclassified Thioalkalivibrio]
MNAYTSRILWNRSGLRRDVPLSRAGTYSGALCGVPFEVFIASNPGGSYTRSGWSVSLRMNGAHVRRTGIQGGLKRAAQVARGLIRDEVAYLRGDELPGRVAS